MNHNLVAAMLIGMVSGEFRQPRRPTDKNRLHTERARRGSPEEADRIAAAEAKRARKAARAQSSGDCDHVA